MQLLLPRSSGWLNPEIEGCYYRRWKRKRKRRVMRNMLEVDDNMCENPTCKREENLETKVVGKKDIH